MNLDDAVREAGAIEGWMAEDELRWLGERAAEHELILEVGSWQGRSTKVLALMTPGKVVSVDNLAFDAAGYGDGDADRHFDERLRAELRAGKVEKVRKESVAVAKRMRRSPDMIFIDGGHEREEVLADLLAWSRRLKLGGLLCGHDGTFPEVQVALTEALDGRWKLAGPGSIWVAT